MIVLLPLLNSALAAAPTVDVQLGSDFPLDVGGRVTVEGPYRLRATAAVGWMPPAYLDTINAFCTGVGWYDDTTALLIDTALQNALIARFHLGWRPFPKLGFQFELGYGFAGLGGGLSGSDAISAVTGEDLPEESDEPYTFLVKAAAHQFDVTLGWEWTIKRHFLIRADLGGVFTLGAQTDIEPDFEPRPIVEGKIDAAEIAGEEYINDTLTSYVHSPTIGLMIGWRFGGEK